ncbi:MAG: DUF4149 domain-containing protein [Pyrinomonadaceae bacterium]|nr:DUF4149 domain-containing protein [Pyrinomonadaceae bacterium]
MNAQLERRKTHAIGSLQTLRTDVVKQNEAKASGAALGFVAEAGYLILALWLGAGLFLSFVVAPGAFRVAPSRETAGAMVGYGLSFLNTSGFFVGLVLLVSAWRWRGKEGRSRRVEIIALLVLSIFAGINQWVIAVRLREIRQGVGRAIDEIAISDPARVMFGRWHASSMVALLICMLAAAVALAAMKRRRSSEAKF